MNQENKIQADHLESLENETMVNSTSTVGKKVQNILPECDSGVSRIDANREQKPIDAGKSTCTRSVDSVT
jgi:hypothetical protein